LKTPHPRVAQRAIEPDAIEEAHHGHQEGGEEAGQEGGEEVRKEEEVTA
jgi:hypothetical protein